MKTKALWEASLLEQPGKYKSHMNYLAQKVTEAAETWWDAGAPGPASAMSATTRQQPAYGGGSGYGGGYGGASTMLTASPGVARRLSPGVTRRMSPQRMSFGSPQAGETRYSPSPRGAGERFLPSPRAGGNPRSPSFA